MSNKNENESETKPTRLSHTKAYELAGIFARLEQLKNSPPEVQILRPSGEEARTPDAQQLTRDTEIQVLMEHLVTAWMQHGPEFLGAWFAMQAEYGPLIRALAPIVKRCVEMPVAEAPLMPDSMRPNTGPEGGSNV